MPRKSISYARVRSPCNQRRSRIGEDVPRADGPKQGCWVQERDCGSRRHPLTLCKLQKVRATQTYWTVQVLFKPNKNLTNVPELANQAIRYMSTRSQTNSVELSKELSLPLTDTFFIINKLSETQRIELTPDKKHWRLTAEERRRLRRRNANEETL